MNDKLKEIYKEFGSNICLAPFFSAWYSSVSNTGKNTLRPCSVTDGNWAVDSPTLLATFNNDKWRNLRKNFIDGSCTSTESCVGCAHAENINSSSFRQQVNKFTSEKIEIDLISSIHKIIDNNYHSDKIYILEYFPSNYCNYECIMCNSGASSRRATFESKIYNIKLVHESSNPVESDFYSILDALTVLQLTGGETILQPQVHKLIDYLIERDLAKNITVTMLTNLSSFPKQLQDKFKQFKNVYYTLSIDGTGKVLEYQRRGANWKDVEENAITINKNFGSVVNYVLTAVNVFNFIEFVAWLHKQRLDLVIISIENSTNYLTVASVPDELKLILLEKLRQEKSIYTDHWCIELFDTLISILTQIKFNSGDLARFIERIKIEDRASVHPLADIVPEWKPYFE